MSVQDEVAVENDYFTVAGSFRERLREALGKVGRAASGPTASISEVAQIGNRYADQIPDKKVPVASRKFVLTDGTEVYIGPSSILDDGKNVLVSDWRSAEALRLTDLSAANPGDVASTRGFSCARDENKVIAIFDDHWQEFANLVSGCTTELIEKGLPPAEASQLAQTQFNDFLLEELQKSRDAKMQSIIGTLQKSQYDIIRAPLNSFMTIQGGPGTGKTIVALHRLSYLMFHDSKLKPEDILFVGPNDNFFSYIQDLLPYVDDSRVQFSTAVQLCRVSVENVSEIESDQLMLLKESHLMKPFIEAALWQRIRRPSEDIKIGGSRLSIDTVERLIDDSSMSGSYMQGRGRLRTLIEQELLSDRSAQAVPPTLIEPVVQSIWPRFTPAEFLRDLFGSRDRLLSAANSEFRATDVQMLYRRAADKISEQVWGISDLALLDFVAEILDVPAVKYSYLVVDEAQDLTPMQRLAVLSRSKDGSALMMGDLAQSSLNSGLRDWHQLHSLIAENFSNWKVDPIHRDLTIAYRLPSEIVKFLEESFSPEVLQARVPRLYAVRETDNCMFEYTLDPGDEFTDTDVLESILGPVIDDLVSSSEREESRSTAVILPNSLASSAEYLRDFEKKNVKIMTPLQAKGLEFDHVVIVDPQSIALDGDFGWNELYIAVTRPTQTLTFIYEHEGVFPYDVDYLIARESEDQASPTSSTYASSSLQSARLEIDMRDHVAEEISDFLRQNVSQSNWAHILLLIQEKLYE